MLYGHSEHREFVQLPVHGVTHRQHVRQLYDVRVHLITSTFLNLAVVLPVQYNSTSLLMYAPYRRSCVMRKLDVRLCENKGTDQLCSNCTADLRLCFRFTHSTIPLLPKSKISSI